MEIQLLALKLGMVAALFLPQALSVLSSLLLPSSRHSVYPCVQYEGKNQEMGFKALVSACQLDFPNTKLNYPPVHQNEYKASSLSDLLLENNGAVRCSVFEQL